MAPHPIGWCALTLDMGGSHLTAALVHLASRALLPGTRRLRVCLPAWAVAAPGTHHRVLGAPVAVGLALPAPFESDTDEPCLQPECPALFNLNVPPALRAVGTACSLWVWTRAS